MASCKDTSLSIRKHHSNSSTNLVALHGIAEALATGFLLALNQEDQVAFQRPLAQELRCSASNGEDRAFVVRRTAAVEVAVPTGECEWIGGPAVGRGGDDIVMSILQAL